MLGSCMVICGQVCGHTRVGLVVQRKNDADAARGARHRSSRLWTGECGYLPDSQLASHLARSWKRLSQSLPSQLQPEMGTHPLPSCA